MQRLLFTIGCLLMGLAMYGQTAFQTIVPVQPVISGESFTVQYVLKGNENEPELVLPDFTPCRLISGPDIHTARIGPVTTRNYVFTLLAPAPGRYRIPGITARLEGSLLQSRDNYIIVSAKMKPGKPLQQEAGSDYYLAPGENAQERIRQNLFVTVSVNKRSCYPGEPLTATFKLYSRLESKSDIVKNPGFYGFTVYDMISLDDKQVATEEINGRLFDVHTIRKVQLYPLQSGIYTIDAMQVNNKVEFSRSKIYKKTEQEIIEGLGGGSDEPGDANVEVVETEIRTEPVSITVKPLPAKNKPEGFGGALGQFTIRAVTSAAKLAKNEEGFLAITIQGKGNFVQLEAPEINWPAGLEGFEPIIKDSLDKTSVPLQGSRTFRYAFVTGVPGNYQLPPVRFSYFDEGTAAFRTIETEAIQFSVSNEEKPAVVSTTTPGNSIASANKKAARTAVIIVVSLVLLILLYWIIKKKEQPAPEPEPKPALPAVNELLQPARDALLSDTSVFYAHLQQAVWVYLQQQFLLSGSEVNKPFAAAKMKAAGVADETIAALFDVLTTCETGLFTNAELSEGKEALLNTAADTMEKMSGTLH